MLQAVCSRCLSAVDVSAATLESACEGREARTIYAADDLAFPGIALPATALTCGQCGAETVPIVVSADVAASLREYLDLQGR